jgi:hypothetical protein
MIARIKISPHCTRMPRSIYTFINMQDVFNMTRMDEAVTTLLTKT